ncbi:RAMP superfamily CRISPR-associated protein [Candidatus Venteria ishoeyi]|uniref:RAMP superfamily protein n=1 Tax=Candidatus Venteria ishoeyi TaxID=1899563 RepID=A0A1H6FDL3_9GAMM|nr:RAMP superfamily CRISPR-associated protein [Candidatus Venteria ishoeyi]SEH08162.1 RAMP superfamily protein [Candidatus Venteria ishoeyi]
MIAEYERVKIAGRLITQSDLHIGSGEREILEDDKTKYYQGICLDFEQQAYLPATSLRGMLARFARILIETKQMSPQDYQTLFGFSNPHHQDGQAGCLRVYDARLSEPLAQKYYRTHASIDPVTGTAQAHKLFTLASVPGDTTFSATFELDRIESRLLDVFMGLLASWNGSAQSALGSGRSKGRGRLSWQRDTIRTLSKEQLQNWLKNESATVLDDSVYTTVKTDDDPPAALSNLPHICLNLHPEHRFLINDPEAVKAAEIQAENEEGSHAADLISMITPKGYAMIPATSLRGWLRARVQKILSTCQITQNTQDEILAQLFGNAERQGLIYIDDAIAAHPIDYQTQYFNAVDRFTGGVADGALYSVEAADNKTLTTTISLPDATRLNTKEYHAHKALLLLAARDILEGELQLGWGKARGYGQFSVEILNNDNIINDWDTLKSKLENYPLQDWIDALQALKNKENTHA